MQQKQQQANQEKQQEKMKESEKLEEIMKGTQNFNWEQLDKIRKRQKDLAMSYDNCAMAGKLKKKI